MSYTTFEKTFQWPFYLFLKGTDLYEKGTLKNTCLQGKDKALKKSIFFCCLSLYNPHDVTKNKRILILITSTRGIFLFFLPVWK